MTQDAKGALAPIRDKIKEAAGQLKELAGRGWPLIVVLANPMNCPIPFTAQTVMAAMYGDLIMQGAVGPDGSTTEWEWVAGRNGRLRTNHQHLNAVLASKRRHRGFSR